MSCPRPVEPIVWAEFEVLLREALGAPSTVLIEPQLSLPEIASGSASQSAAWILVESLAGRSLDARLLRTIERLDEALAWINVARSQGNQDALVPAVSRIWLRPLHGHDIGPMYDVSMAAESFHRWRFKGQRPTPEQFSNLIHQGVLAQFIVEHRATLSRQGLVTAYNYSAENQIAWLAYQRLQAPVEGGELHIGMFHLIDFVFSRFPLRKLFLDLMEWNDTLIAGGFGPIEAEGRLREYSYFAGRWWDRVYYSISRNNWDYYAKPWRDRLGDGLAPLFDPTL